MSDAIHKRLKIMCIATTNRAADIDALFKDALERGTYNWDVTIVRAVGIILLASLQVS